MIMIRPYIIATAALLLLPFSLAHPAELVVPEGVSRGGCAAEVPPEFESLVSEMARDEDAGLTPHTAHKLKSKLKSSQFSHRATSPITIRVYFHVVAASTSVKDGYISDKMITDQLAVLNSNYGNSSIKYVFGATDRTINATLAVDSPGTELEMKKKLRKGDYKTLNLYFLKSLRQNSLGYCSFPGKVVKGSSQFYLDGCSVRSDTVPGGALRNFNKGKTATHEVGHWFGLLHTFQGGCSGTGDQISDTPASASATYGCPTGRDSCTGLPGLDPIHNYMDYSFDGCYTNFTPMQSTRMLDMYSKYRAAG